MLSREDTTWALSPSTRVGGGARYRPAEADEKVEHVVDTRTGRLVLAPSRARGVDRLAQTGGAAFTDQVGDAGRKNREMHDRLPGVFLALHEPSIAPTTDSSRRDEAQGVRDGEPASGSNGAAALNTSASWAEPSPRLTGTKRRLATLQNVIDDRPRTSDGPG